VRDSRQNYPQKSSGKVIALKTGLWQTIPGENNENPLVCPTPAKEGIVRLDIPEG
jgi:hypothetical protein